MKKVILLVACILSIEKSFACCHAEQTRLFPVGITNGKIISVQFILYRECDYKNMKESVKNGMTFLWKGKVNLVAHEKDTTVLLKKIDTLISFTECTCKSNEIETLSKYNENLQPYFKKAFTEAKKLKGFNVLEFISAKHIVFKEDSLVSVNDSLATVQIDQKPYSFKPVQQGPGPVCAPKTLRKYKTGHTCIYIITATDFYFDDSGPALVPAPLPNIISIENSFYYDNIHWHGYNYDYVIVEQRF